MSFSLYFSEACTNFYKYLKAVAIFELIYSIFGKRKIFNSHWAESTVDGPVALGAGNLACLWSGLAWRIIRGARHEVCPWHDRRSHNTHAGRRRWAAQRRAAG
jgi:hypothetical protein